MLNKKIEILEDAISSIAAMINNTQDVAQDSQAEANYHKGAMQSRYDTFKERRSIWWRLLGRDYRL